MSETNDDRGHENARRLNVLRIVYGLFGIVLCVLGLLYYKSVIGTPVGHNSRIITSTKPKAAPAQKKAKLWDQLTVDEYDNPTVYALAELDGKELVWRLTQQKFVWAKGVGWVHDGTTLAAFDAQGDLVQKNVISKLEQSCLDVGNEFVLTTSDYTDVESAYQALVLDSMVGEELVPAGQGFEGTVFGPSMHDRRIYLEESGEGVTIRVSSLPSNESS